MPAGQRYPHRRLVPTSALALTYLTSLHTHARRPALPAPPPGPDVRPWLLSLPLLAFVRLPQPTCPPPQPTCPPPVRNLPAPRRNPPRLSHMLAATRCDRLIYRPRYTLNARCNRRRSGCERSGCGSERRARCERHARPAPPPTQADALGRWSSVCWGSGAALGPSMRLRCAQRVRTSGSHERMHPPMIA